MVRFHFMSTALASCVRRRISVRENSARLLRGGLEEVAGLARNGVPLDAKPLDFIGYSEPRAHLEGTVTLAAATKAITQATRRYAKHQFR
jgi:tRNA A37 N6-isopentenylltransferase MiaA